jgi:septum site-determining protein MinC
VLILKETLRSGRAVRHAGPVFVIGDVNPGAEIHAEGDVVIWGKLRGLVHAGSAGDAEAVVCALDLNPTQLRIADKITVPPKDPRRQAIPEMAVIRAQQIVAEPWRSKA